jgi:hypothetical protein
MMKVTRGNDDDLLESSAARFTAGALLGMGLGMLVAARLARRSPVTAAHSESEAAVRRQRPSRIHRLAGELEEIDELEDMVLNAFLRDELLGLRAVDIGAISQGIVEISGTVFSDAESKRAVALANAVPGVRTVVNRLVVESGAVRVRTAPARRATFSYTEGRVGGMGRRRQSPGTDPDRPDDSQKLRDDALAAADRDQWLDEGLAAPAGRGDAGTGLGEPTPVNFRDDELDNQDPRGGLEI